jgi:hypothetical protein
MRSGTLVRLKPEEVDVVIYEEPFEGPMVCFLPGGTVGMYLESKVDPLRKDFVYHRLVFHEIGTLFGWVMSSHVETIE